MSTQVDGRVLPALPHHSLSSLRTTVSVPPPSTTQKPSATDLGRSASYTYLPALVDEPSPPTIKRTYSESVLSLPPEPTPKMKDIVPSANMELFRLASRKSKKKKAPKFSVAPDDDDNQPRESAKSISENDDLPKSLSRSVTGTLRTFARKPWTSSPRPSSPATKEGNSPSRKRSHSPGKKKAPVPANPITVPEPVASRPPSRSREDENLLMEDPTLNTKHTGKQPAPIQRPLSVMGVKNKSDLSLKRLSRNSSSTSLRSSISNDRSYSRLSLGKIPPLPTSFSSDRLSALNAEVSKRKDPLWSAFRAIDGEFISFHAKTSLQKVKVLRMHLLPFLVKYANHPSNRALRAEELDRRIVILNKWWTGLLEMLNGANNQSISGTDRPAFLESASMIMQRPEWRIPSFLPTTSESPRRNSIPKSKSTNSLESDDPDFLVDTIHQNVQNTFVQNLLSQMAFVVDKLSLRAAPASLVTFAGKTCAYAFFFCPGVGDMLARLWLLPAGTLRRIFTEFGNMRGDNLDLVSSVLTGNFPPPIRSLSVSSQAGLSRHLQRRAQIPPGSENVRWLGPWVGRWCGRDTDLFFVFTKYYHVLVSEFLPEEVSLKDRAGVPGLIPVCAQILVVLETTIHRQAGQNAADNYSGGMGHNIDNPDALAPLPMTISNASRSIAENRLIILLRDILGEISPENTRLRNLFVGSFDGVTKAATRKISLYNNDACYVLCDFMEEVLPIMFRYHQSYNDTPVLDWPFWFQVCKQMMQSQTSLTQLRLIAFVYSTWSILISNEERKRQLVLEWLLDPIIFERNFCHWSPMIRHYFYRLLCWRVARYDGQASELDIEILQTLTARLNKCWANYQYLTAEAEMRATIPPSSAPCSPAPSRVLIIIRTDSQPILGGSVAALEKLLPSAMADPSSPYLSHSSALNTFPSADQPLLANKKRWSLFRGLNVFSPPGNNRPGEVTPPGSPDENGRPTSVDISSGLSNTTTPGKLSNRPATPPHQAFSFKFSLEWVQSRAASENRNRTLAAPQLPPNAQSILRRRQSSESGGSRSSKSSGGSEARRKGKGAEVRPLKPKDHEMATARYSGRALAEWGQVLQECRNFYSRRKQEGVPRDNLVETPTMGVETFRLMG